MFDVLIAVFAAAVLVLVGFLVYGRLLLPIRGKGCSVSVVIRAEGNCPDLQRVYDGAKWLAARGELPIVILDAGMNEDTKKIAQKLEKYESAEI